MNAAYTTYGPPETIEVIEARDVPGRTVRESPALVPVYATAVTERHLRLGFVDFPSADVSSDLASSLTLDAPREER